MCGKLTNDPRLRGIDSNLFPSLPECGVNRRLSWLEPAARKRNLTLVRIQRLRSPGKQHSRLAAVIE